MKLMKPLSLCQELLKLHAVKPGKLLGLDVGSSCIGLAVSDFNNQIASPLSVMYMHRHYYVKRASEFQNLDCNSGPDLNPSLALIMENLPLLSRSDSLAQKLIKEESEKERALKRENGIRSIQSYINNARDAKDMDEALKLFDEAYMVCQALCKRDFEIEENMYGPLLQFLIENKMTEKFYSLYDTIKEESPISLSTLAYYEMCLLIEIGDRDKIQMLLANKNSSIINESYLVALCERDQKEEILVVLETIDIKKLSVDEDMERIFRSFGRLLLESHAKKFIRELNTNNNKGFNLSDLIYIYAMSIPNIQIQDIITKVKILQSELKVAPSSVPLKKLFEAWYDSLKDHDQNFVSKLRRYIRLLEILQDNELLEDKCKRMIVYHVRLCVRLKLLSETVGFLKLHLKMASTSEMAIDTKSLLFEVFAQIAEMEPTDVQFGLDLLRALKEEMRIQPSRMVLGFLLIACAKAKDKHHAYTVWREYQKAGLPYNIVNYLSMYRSLLASGAHNEAAILFEQHICNEDDRRVLLVAKQFLEGENLNDYK